MIKIQKCRTRAHKALVGCLCVVAALSFTQDHLNLYSHASHQSSSGASTCVLTIKPHNASASSYSTALAATTDSYLPNYVSR